MGTVLASADVIDRLRQRYDTGRRAGAGRRRAGAAPVRAAAILGLARRRAGAPTTSDLWSAAAPNWRSLEDALAAHRAGRGSVIEVIGPPGIGKTLLLQAFLGHGADPAGDGRR